MFLRKEIVLCDNSEDFGACRFDLLLYDSYEDFLEGDAPVKVVGSTSNYELAYKLEYLFNLVSSPKSFEHDGKKDFTILNLVNERDLKL